MDYSFKCVTHGKLWPQKIILTWYFMKCYHVTTMKKKRSGPTSVRMSLEAKRLREALSNKLGISMAAVLEIAVRRLADIEGIEVQIQAGGEEKTKKEPEGATP